MLSLATSISLIRKLAKSREYQTLYSSAKEIKITFFQDSFDLTPVQLLFLNYLNFYSSVSLDIYLREVDERVLENEIYEDAYMYYKNKVEKKKMDNLNKPYSPMPTQEFQEKSKWHFRSPKKL